MTKVKKRTSRLNTIRYRIIISVLLLILCFQVISSIFQSYQVNSIYMEGFIKGATNLSYVVFLSLHKMVRIAKIIEPEISPEKLSEYTDLYIQIVQQQEFESVLGLQEDLKTISFISRQEKIIVSSEKDGSDIVHSSVWRENIEKPSQDYRLITANRSMYQKRTKDHVLVFIPYRFEDIYLGGLILSYDISKLLAAKQQLYTINASLVITYMMLASVLIYLFITKVLTRPVRELTRMMEKMAGGEYDQWFHIQNLDEIGQMGESVNELVTALQQTYTEIQNVVNDGQKNSVSNEIHKAESELRLLSRKLIDTIEAERKKIAIDLHDEVGKSLTILQCDLNIIEQALNEREDRNNKHCENAIREVKQLAKTIRKTCSRLRPDLLDDLGLTSAIESQIETFNNQMEDLTLRFACNNYDRRTEPDTELTLYRVFQEAISNVVRHAHAEHVDVSLFFNNATVSLEIRDDGVGFHPDERGLPKNGDGPGIGLLSMKERVLSLDGSIEIDSSKRRGTRIKVVLPVPKVRYEQG